MGSHGMPAVSPMSGCQGGHIPAGEMRLTGQNMCDMRGLGSNIKFKTNMANAFLDLDSTSTEISFHFKEVLYLGDETDDNCTSENISIPGSESNIDETETESFRQTNITTI